ncbi:hypothetical protein MesoLjLb_18780 [Mesorhizobium sp. L-8-3]|nr:hypothetical protein MesoLjLb_18780 [Mesorhizobium sp. L-8-3]
MTVPDEPFRHVLVTSSASGDHPAVSIPIDLMAGRRRSGAQEVVEDERGDLAAPVGLPRLVAAELPALWRIDAVEPDPLAVDLDRVAVDNGRATNYFGFVAGSSNRR